MTDCQVAGELDKLIQKHANDIVDRAWDAHMARVTACRAQWLVLEVRPPWLPYLQTYLEHNS